MEGTESEEKGKDRSFIARIFIASERTYCFPNLKIKHIVFALLDMILLLGGSLLLAKTHHIPTTVAITLPHISCYLTAWMAWSVYSGMYMSDGCGLPHLAWLVFKIFLTPPTTIYYIISLASDIPYPCEQLIQDGQGHMCVTEPSDSNPWPRDTEEMVLKQRLLPAIITVLAVYFVNNWICIRTFFGYGEHKDEESKQEG